MKIGFCGSGLFAAECLEHISRKIRPEWVITNSPKKAGRGLKLRPTPVQQVAEKLNLSLKTTINMSRDQQLLTWIEENCPDIILVIDFGHLIKEPILSLPKFGCINIHPSKLPTYRGSSPLQRALIDGLTNTAVTIFKLDSGMDTGPVLTQRNIVIRDDDDFESLLKTSALIGSEALLEYICDFDAKDWVFTQQLQVGVSLAPKIEKFEGKLDWQSTAFDLYNKIRALKQSPGTFCTICGKRLRIKEAELINKTGKAATIISIENGMPVIACSKGALKLISVQQEGKKEQKADEWLRGSRLQIGDKFT